MNHYDEFKETVIRILEEKAGDIGEIVVRKVHKNNCMKDSVSLRRDGVNIVPTLYLNDFYEEYKENTGDLDELVSQLLELLKKDFSEDVSLSIGTDKAFLQLINKDRNEEFLKNAPFHEAVGDLVYTYRLLAGIRDYGIMSTHVDNKMMKELAVSEDELFDIAKENTRKYFPTTVRSIASVLESFGVENFPELFSEIDESVPMLVLSNDMKINGATNICYEDELLKISEALKDNMYILPSSIHECIIVPEKMGEISALRKMVKEVNKYEVAESDFLSDNVLYFSREKGLVVA